MIVNSVWEAKSKAGIDVHLSDDEAKEFQAAAKLIDKDRHFTIYGCQDCINTLVKFIFENQGKVNLQFNPAEENVIIKNIADESEA